MTSVYAVISPGKITDTSAVRKPKMQNCVNNGINVGVIGANWSTIQTTSGGAVTTSGIQGALDDAQNVGMKIVLQINLQYPPSFVTSGVEQFKDQNAVLWTDSDGTGAAGDRVRNWQWTAQGRTYVADLFTKLGASGIASHPALMGARMGGGSFGEAQYAPITTSPMQWWIYGTSLQTGTGLASDQVVCPHPGRTPLFNGTNDAFDHDIANWWLNGMNVWINWLIAQHKSAGFGSTGFQNLWVLHPSTGVRDRPHTDSGWIQEVARGVDPRRLMASYAHDNKVWPWSTWNDNTGSSPAEVAMGSCVKLLKEANSYGKLGRFASENSHTNSDLAGSIAVSEGLSADNATGAKGWLFNWLNYDSLVGNAPGDVTLAQYAAKIAAGASRVQGQDAFGNPVGAILTNPDVSGGITISAGTTDINAIVQANPAGTKFVLLPGVTYHVTTPIVPKNNNIIVGQLDASGNPSVIDGGGTVDRAIRGNAGSGAGTGFAIRNIVFDNFTSSTLGVVTVGTGSIVEDCEIRNTTGAAPIGIWSGGTGTGAIVRRNWVHHNGKYGMGGNGDSVQILNNDISYNNIDHNFNGSFDAGGTKFASGVNNFLIKGNFAHHNGGAGLWDDGDGYNVVYDSNKVWYNDFAGIDHEIGWDCVISNNDVRYNALYYLDPAHQPGSSGSIYYGSDISVNTSMNVEIYGNTVVTKGNGIGLISAVRGSGTHAPHVGVTNVLTNVYVHDNNITVEAGGTRAAGLVGLTSAVNDTTNNFVDNTYTTPDSTSAWWIWNTTKTWAQWQAVPKDVIVLPETFGAVGNGTTDDTTALNSALAACGPGKAVHINSGKIYKHNNIVTAGLAGTTVSGSGELRAGTESVSAFKIDADHVTLSGVKLTCPTTTTRGTAPQQHKIWATAHTNMILRDVNVDTSAGAGIFVQGASYYLIEDCTVANTRADGIHQTAGSNNGIVRRPTITNVGDDGVAVVSYLSDGVLCHDITVDTPHIVSQTWGRALSVVGGYNVTFTNIDVDSSSAAALYFASESGTFNTYSVYNVTVNGGTITNANQNATVDHGAIVMWCAQSGQTIHDITVTNLTITNTRTTASRTVALLQDAGGIYHTTLTNLAINGTGSPITNLLTNSAPTSAYNSSGWVVNGVTQLAHNGWSNLLSWAPPTGYSGYTSYAIAADGTGTLSTTSSGVVTHTLVDTVNYKITAPSIITSPIIIKGGRDVVWIGGRITLGYQGAFASGQRRRALHIGSGTSPISGRVVHLEGIFMDGSDLADAINLDCPEAIVQVQNCRADGYHFRSCDDRDSTNQFAGKGTHPDGIQPWGGCKELRVDGYTCLSSYQGLFLNTIEGSVPAGGDIARIRRYNWKSVGFTSTEEGPVSGGAYSTNVIRSSFDATSESWSFGNSGTQSLAQTTAEAQTGVGSLSATRTFGTAFDQVWVRSPTGQNIGSDTALKCFVKVPTGTLGTWTAKLGYNLSAAAGSTLFLSSAVSVTPGVWTQVICDIGANGHESSDVDRFVVQVQRASGQASGSVTVYVDTVSSGSISGYTYNGPSTTYYGIRALSLDTMWSNVFLDEGTVFTEHNANSGWAATTNSNATRQTSTGSGFYWTRRYDPTHPSADPNGYVLDPSPGTARFQDTLYPPPEIVTAGYASWTSEPRLKNWDGTVTGRVYGGAPPAGDYVPATLPGLTYSSPGYSVIPNPALYTSVYGATY